MPGARCLNREGKAAPASWQLGRLCSGEFGLFWRGVLCPSTARGSTKPDGSWQHSCHGGADTGDVALMAHKSCPEHWGVNSRLMYDPRS